MARTASSFGGEEQYHQYSFVSKIGGTCSGTSGCFTFWPNQTASDTTYWGRDGNSFAAFLIGQSGTANALESTARSALDCSYCRAVSCRTTGRCDRTSPSISDCAGATILRATKRTATQPTSVQPLPIRGRTDIPGALVFAGNGPGRNGNVGETWANTYYKDFEPRVGFAWSPSSHAQICPSRQCRHLLRAAGLCRFRPRNAARVHGQSNPVHWRSSVRSAGRCRASRVADHSRPRSNPVEWPRSGLRGAKLRASGDGGTWNLENQVQLRPDLFFSLGYIGNHATHLHGLLNYPNDIPLSDLSMGTCLLWWAVAPCPNGFSSPPIRPTPASPAHPAAPMESPNQWSRPCVRFRKYGYINQDSYLQNVGQSSYDALMAKLERRFHNGLNVLASYTFSKTITDADSIQPYYSTLQSQGGTQNPYDHKAEKAVSNQDIPNNFVASYIYELPVGRGKQFLAGTPATRQRDHRRLENQRRACAIWAASRSASLAPMAFRASTMAFVPTACPVKPCAARAHSTPLLQQHRHYRIRPDFGRMHHRLLELRLPSRIPTLIPGSTFLMYSAICRATLPTSGLPVLRRGFRHGQDILHHGTGEGGVPRGVFQRIQPALVQQTRFRRSGHQLRPGRQYASRTEKRPVRAAD